MNKHEYYLAVKTLASPIFEVNSWDNIILYPWAVYPDRSLKLYQTFKPEGEYTINDYASLPEHSFSKRVIEEAGLKHIYGINFVPAHVEHKGATHEFYILNFLNEIECLDKINSKYNWNKKSQEIRSIRKLVLDMEKLKQIPLKKRLIFLLEEGSIALFHKSIVEQIMKTNPKGMKFITPDEFEYGMK